MSQIVEYGIKCPNCVDGLCSVATSPKKDRIKKHWRYQCRSCGHQFSHYGAKGLPKVMLQDPETVAAVRFVLLNMNKMSQREIGLSVGMSRVVVGNIVCGRSHRSYFPELPRKEVIERVETCRNCLLAMDAHAQPEAFQCSLGVPEADGNPRWGQYCAAFADKAES